MRLSPGSTIRYQPSGTLVKETIPQTEVLGFEGGVGVALGVLLGVSVALGVLLGVSVDVGVLLAVSEGVGVEHLSLERFQESLC